MMIPGVDVSSLLVTCRNKSSADQHYVPAIRLGGWEGEIVLVAPGDPVPELEKFKGLLMTGGDDIHPRHWDEAEAVHPLATPDPDRDDLELPLARRAWELGLPILGICRGEQLLNVALGGSLIQDIPSHYHCEPGLHQLGSSSLPPQLAHTVTVKAGTRLRSLVGDGRDRGQQPAPPGREAPRPGPAGRGLARAHGPGRGLPDRRGGGPGPHPLGGGGPVAPGKPRDHGPPRRPSALGIFQGFAAALRERP